MKKKMALVSCYNTHTAPTSILNISLDFNFSIKDFNFLTKFYLVIVFRVSKEKNCNFDFLLRPARDTTTRNNGHDNDHRGPE